MIRRIILKNFMSHRETIIEPAPGLTVITGPNNCGKSALVSALQAMVRTPRGKYMMRHGELLTRVTVETSEGDVLTWQRTPKRVAYYVNGTLTDRVVPDDWHDKLRLSEVVLGDQGGKRFDIHFGEQKRPIFLLGDSPGDAAAFFASSSDAAWLMEMQKVHRTRTSERRRDAARLTALEEELGAQLEALEPLGELSAQIEALEMEHGALEDLGARHSALDTDTQTLGEASTRARQARKSFSALVLLKAPPDLPETDTLTQLVASLADVQQALTRYSAEAEALSALETPPERPETHAFDRLTAELAVATHAAHRHSDTSAALEGLTDPPDIAEEAPLETLVGTLPGSLLASALATSQSAFFATLQPPPKLAETHALETHSDRLAAALDASSMATATAEPLASLSTPPTLDDPSALTAHIDGLKTHRASTARASTLAQSLSTLQTPPEILDPKPFERTLDALTTASLAHERPSRRARALDGLDTPPETADPTPIAAIIESLEAASANNDTRNSRSAALSELGQPPEPTDPSSLEDLIKTLAEASQAASMLDTVREAHTALSMPPEPVDTSEIAALMVAIEQAKDDCEGHAQRVAEHAQAVAGAEADLAEWTRRHPICPTCGAPTVPGRLLEHHHEVRP